jgi:hypothetical protein
VARSMVARYLVAAFAFMAAATWLGVGLQGGFTCLLVFVLALQAVRLYQRRSGSHRRPARSPRDRPPRHLPAHEKERLISPPRAAVGDRSRASARLYDGDRDGLGWPVPSEATR